MSDKNWQSTSSTDISAGSNWSGNVALATGDNGILNGIGTAALSTGLPQATNILGLTLNIFDTFLAYVGLEASGTNLASYFKVGTSGTTNLHVGRNAGGVSGNGSAMILFDGSTGTLIANVYKTAKSTGTFPALCLLGSGITLNAYGGQTGVAVRLNEAATLSALALLGNNAVVRLGRGIQYPSIVRVEAGFLYTSGTNGITTLKISGDKATAQTEVDETGTIATSTLTEGGILIHNGTGGLTNVSVGNGCTLDMTGDARAKTLDAVTAYAGANVFLDNGVSTSITHSAGGTNIPVITCPDGVGKVKITAPAGMALKIQ